MAAPQLFDFIAQLEDDGELVRIAAEVDPVLELAHVVDRAAKQPGGGPAILFENVRQHSMPVVANLLGSERRICRALRVESLDGIGQRLTEFLQPALPHRWLDAIKLMPHLNSLTKLAPRTVKAGVCQQVVQMGRDVDLLRLPVPKCWPQDAGPLITAGQLITEHPRSESTDLGHAPLLVLDRDSLAVLWRDQDTGWKNFLEHRRAGTPMPVAVSLGGDPLLTFFARMPAPPSVNKALLAGLLRDENMEVVPCRSIALEVPADAEIVIEGLIDVAADPVQIGSIGCESGFYSLPDYAPRMRVTAVTHRSNPILPMTILSRPPSELDWIARAAERMLLPFVQLFASEIVNLHLPPCGTHQNLLFVAIDKQHPQQARKVMHALWSLDWWTSAKVIVVVDRDVDVHDEQAVWFHVGANVHPGRDVSFGEGATHATDHASPVRGVGHKMGIDATRKLPEEGHPREWPEAVAADLATQQLVAERWLDYGLPDSPRLKSPMPELRATGS